MSVTTLRILIFTLFPLILGGAVILFDKATSTRERKLEATLIFLFGIGVGGAGIANFIAHFFLSDIVAESIGWEAGSPFQLEVAFANLLIGLLGIIATSRRDGFREATVIAATTFGVGATIVHIMDILATGNLAPGNTIQNVGNLLKPALLILFLVAMRRAEAQPDSEAGSSSFENWRAALLQVSAPITIITASAFALGFALGQAWLVAGIGVLISFVVLGAALRRSQYHELGWG
jgi:hypothetical protein